MKIFKFCAAIAVTAALMTAQPVFGATGHAAYISGTAVGAAAQVPEAGSTFALLLLSFLALVGATRLASFRQRKRKAV